jgi:hypothetical protein
MKIMLDIRRGRTACLPPIMPGRPFTGPNDPRNGRGKPKGLSSWIKEHTEGGTELAALFLSVARGEPQVIPKTVNVSGVEHEIEIEGDMRVLVPDLEQRLSCARWLAERYWGKVPDKVALTDAEGDDVFDPKELPQDGLLGLASLLAAVARRPDEAQEARADDKRRAEPSELPQVH